MKKDELVTERMQRFITELKPSTKTVHRTENVELTVLCLITDGAKCCFKIDLGSDYDLTCKDKLPIAFTIR